MSLERADVRQILEQLTQPGLDLAALLAIWRARPPEEWAAERDVIARLGERVLRAGAPLSAFDILSAGCKRWPADVRMRQLLGLALADSGATERAARQLEELEREGDTGEETLGLLARLHKDRALAAGSDAERGEHLRHAHEAYVKASSPPVRYWTRINAATTALLLGRDELARHLARETGDWCREELAQARARGDDTYWLLATLGESALVLGEHEAAADWYRAAAAAGAGRYRDLRSTRRQARLIMDRYGRRDPEIEACLRLPAVCVFAGHMIDRPGRPVPRFPAELEPAVAHEIRTWLAQSGARLGFASAASGSDILFLEAMLDAGGQVTIVLPCAREQFVEESVAPAGAGAWIDRFDAVLGRATTVVTASEQRIGHDGVAYEYANLLLLGLGTIEAQYLETDLRFLTVWDGKPGDGPGGTASIAQRWKSGEHQVERIPLDQLLASERGPVAPTTAQDVRSTQAMPSTPPARIVAVLFGDAVDFSKLTEEQVPRFVRHFLGLAGDLTRSAPTPPALKNTWGDGLYLVFESVRAAGLFALELRDRIGAADWAAAGLPPKLGLRLALHAGPAWECEDPVTGRLNYFGTHVSQAARIEPITPPGHVYASQAFAALAAAEGVREFRCDYVGQTPLAKDHGIRPLYHVRRA